MPSSQIAMRNDRACNTAGQHPLPEWHHGTSHQGPTRETRTSMLYTMNKWKRLILICLWPYGMRHANDVANATPRKGEELSPLEKFSGVKVTPKLRDFHAFGCPTYVLDNALQSGQESPKWKLHSRLGVYLGQSPVTILQ